MKLYCVMTEIHRGLIIKLSPLYAFKRFRSDRRNICFRRQLNYLHDRLNNSIEVSKQKILLEMTDQLTNAGKSSKAYWSILKSFLNNLRWCRARDLFGSQIPVTTGGFQLRISCIRSSYLIH